LITDKAEGKSIFYKMLYDENDVLKSILVRNVSDSFDHPLLFKLFYKKKKLDSMSILSAEKSRELGFVLFSERSGMGLMRQYYLLGAEGNENSYRPHLEYEKEFRLSPYADTLIRLTEFGADTTFVNRAPKGLQFHRPNENETWYFELEDAMKLPGPLMNQMPYPLAYYFNDWWPYCFLDRQARHAIVVKGRDRWRSSVKYDIRDGNLFKMETVFDSFLNRGSLGNNLFFNENNLVHSVTCSYIGE
jgi:hypothetical protein